VKIVSLIYTHDIIADVKGVEIPFYEKKDRIIHLSTFFQLTVALTEQGRVFAVGDKLAK
jgi:hypothetical protein